MIYTDFMVGAMLVAWFSLLLGIVLTLLSLVHYRKQGLENTKSIWDLKEALERSTEIWHKEKLSSDQAAHDELDKTAENISIHFTKMQAMIEKMQKDFSEKHHTLGERLDSIEYDLRTLKG